MTRLFDWYYCQYSIISIYILFNHCVCIIIEALMCPDTLLLMTILMIFLSALMTVIVRYFPDDHCIHYDDVVILLFCCRYSLLRRGWLFIPEKWLTAYYSVCYSDIVASYYYLYLLFCILRLLLPAHSGTDACCYPLLLRAFMPGVEIEHYRRIRWAPYACVRTFLASLPVFPAFPAASQFSFSGRWPAPAALQKHSSAAAAGPRSNGYVMNQ